MIIKTTKKSILNSMVQELKTKIMKANQKERQNWKDGEARDPSGRKE